MIEAVIFDMDGLLIDSEPLWREAESRIFSSHDVPVTEEMTYQTTGLRTDEVVRHWDKRYPGKMADLAAVGDEIDNAVIALINERGTGKPGVPEALAACEAAGLPIAIASSSSPVMIEAVIEKLGIADKLATIHSAHHEEYGKPHPAVYISTAKQLGVPPEHCLAFEDSANGVLAAKAAKMRCIAIPEADLRNDKRFGIADIILHSLHDFTPEMLKDW